MTGRYDVAVVGSGFAGSLFAMIAKQLGRSVVLIDNGKHPRVTIGESSTPLTNLLLEELATRYDLPAIRPLTKWESWQNTYPEVACGIKRGFTFYHHHRTRPHLTAPDRASQLLVAASPSDSIADTHWYRADFDHLLVRQAQSMGVEYLDETELAGFAESGNGIDMQGRRPDGKVHISAGFLVDASGPRGFLYRTLKLTELPLPNYPGTQALFTHFSGVGRLDQIPFGRSTESPPYPIDDAAVHHLIDGGWIWVLHFNNGVTSAGIAATDELATSLNLCDGEAAWNRLLANLPALRAQFAFAKVDRPFIHIPRLSFRSASIAGKRWALLPSAAGFVDPLLSTGFPLTLLGIAQLAEILKCNPDGEELTAQLRDYAARTEGDLLATAGLVGSLYANLNDFPVFSALTLLYFAAASFSEMSRRLSRPHLATSFLLHDDPVFGPASAELLGRSRHCRTEGESARLVKDILQAIEPFNVAGLGEFSRRNWYPVDSAYLFRSAWKLGAGDEEIACLLERCGFPVSSERRV